MIFLGFKWAFLTEAPCTKFSRPLADFVSTQVSHCLRDAACDVCVAKAQQITCSECGPHRVCFYELHFFYKLEFLVYL